MTRFPLRTALGACAVLASFAPPAIAVPLPLEEIVNGVGTTDDPGPFGDSRIVRGPDGRFLRDEDGRLVREFTPDIQDRAVDDGLEDAFDDFAEIDEFVFDDGRTEDRLIDAGIFITRRIDTFEDSNTYRLLDIFENVGSTSLSGTVVYDTNLGSDGDETVVVDEPGRFVSFEDDDDLPDGTCCGPDGVPDEDGDPVVALVFGSAPFAPISARRLSARDLEDGDEPEDDVYLDVGLTLAPGERFGFLQFATLVLDDMDRSNDVADALSVSGRLLSDPLLTGLSTAEIESIGNFDVSPMPPMAVPEPGTLALFGAGAFGLVAGQRRRRRSRAARRSTDKGE